MDRRTNGPAVQTFGRVSRDSDAFTTSKIYQEFENVVCWSHGPAPERTINSAAFCCYPIEMK